MSSLVSADVHSVSSSLLLTLEELPVNGLQILLRLLTIVVCSVMAYRYFTEGINNHPPMGLTEKVEGSCKKSVVTHTVDLKFSRTTVSEEESDENSTLAESVDAISDASFSEDEADNQKNVISRSALLQYRALAQGACISRTGSLVARRVQDTFAPKQRSWESLQDAVAPKQRNWDSLRIDRMVQGSQDMTLPPGLSYEDSDPLNTILASRERDGITQSPTARAPWRRQASKSAGEPSLSGKVVGAAGLRPMVRI